MCWSPVLAVRMPAARALLSLHGGAAVMLAVWPGAVARAVPCRRLGPLAAVAIRSLVRSHCDVPLFDPLLSLPIYHSWPALQFAVVQPPVWYGIPATQRRAVRLVLVRKLLRCACMPLFASGGALSVGAACRSAVCTYIPAQEPGAWAYASLASRLGVAIHTSRGAPPGAPLCSTPQEL